MKVVVDYCLQILFLWSSGLELLIERVRMCYQQYRGYMVAQKQTFAGVKFWNM